MSTLLLAAILAACGEVPPAKPGAPAGRQVSPEDWRALAAFLEQRATAGEFSGAVLVAKDGRPLLEQAYGLADRERGIANAVDTKFNIASAGKMFTAVAIAQLAEQGKLAFGDPIGRYVSGFPPETADKVTIHQLLTHTSGMGDLPRDRASVMKESPSKLADLMPRIVNQPLQFEPGARFSYSNSGYVVLGAIVERITGQSYYDYVREHVFKPAGMTSTDWYNRNQDVPKLAHGYMRVDDSGRPVTRPQGPESGSGAAPGTLRDNRDFLPPGNPSGGADSTVGDLLRFARALLQHKLLGPELTNTVLTGKVKTRRPGGPPDDSYAYGFADMKISGVRIVGHNGGSAGVGAQLDIYPDLGYTVVILTNYDPDALIPVHRRTHQILTR